jgi:hypothetical protein
MVVPCRTSEVDTGFLTEVLREGGVIGLTTSVEEVEHEQIGVGVGLMGELGQLRLRYAGPAVGAPGSVVLKVPSPFPENRAVGEYFRFYEREGRFYQQLAGKVGLRVPRCYWGCVEPDRGHYALLLEDLSGRVSISQLAGADEARSHEAIASLGKLHAAWWDAPELDGLDWMPRVDDPVNLGAGEQYRQAWPVFLERVGRVLPEEAVELGQRIQGQFEQLLQDAPAEAPLTVCHGDYRLDNLLFSEDQDDDDPVTVVDWQISWVRLPWSDYATSGRTPSS